MGKTDIIIFMSHSGAVDVPGGDINMQAGFPWLREELHLSLRVESPLGVGNQISMIPSNTASAQSLMSSLEIPKAVRQRPLLGRLQVAPK